jgi:hypothetical protein
MKTLKPIVIGTLWVATLFLPAALAYGQVPVMGNCPSVTHLPECLVSISAAKRNGCSVVRIGAGTYDLAKPPKFPIPAIDQVAAAAKKAGVRVQWAIEAWPAHAGGISGLPDIKNADAIRAKIKQPLVDQVCGNDPAPLIELMNEPEADNAPKDGSVFLSQEMGLPKGSVPAALFDVVDAVYSPIDYHGASLVIHEVGGGGSSNYVTAKSWSNRDGGTTPNLSAARFISVLKAHSGTVKYNTYPNMSYASDVTTFTARFMGVTMKNTFAYAHSVLNPLSDLKSELGEVGVSRSGLTNAKWWSLENGLFTVLVKAGQPFDIFTISTTDPNFPQFSVCNVTTGKAIYKDLALPAH